MGRGLGPAQYFLQPDVEPIPSLPFPDRPPVESRALGVRVDGLPDRFFNLVLDEQFGHGSVFSEHMFGDFSFVYSSLCR